MNNKYMHLALKEAHKAFLEGEVPVGAIIVKNDKIIAKAHNKIEKKVNATAHAEILAIEKASKRLNNWRLSNCDIYVSLEPCEMCKGAIKLSRISNIYYAAKRNENNTSYNDIKIENYESESVKLLSTFFREKR